MENSPLFSVVAKQGEIFHNLTKSTNIFAPAAAIWGNQWNYTLFEFPAEELTFVWRCF